MELSRKTLAEFATEVGRNYDTVFRAAKRVIPGAVSAGMLLTPEMENEISSAMRSAKSGGKKSARKSAPAAKEVSAKIAHTEPEKTPENPSLNLLRFLQQVKDGLPAIRRFAFDAVCILIVVGHAALIWYDCAEMWETPGIIGGGLAFLFVLGAILIATDKTRNRTSGYALGFMFVVDFAAYFVHFPTFLRYASIGEIQTGALCGFVCLLSFAALYLYQDSKLD